MESGSGGEVDVEADDNDEWEMSTTTVEASRFTGSKEPFFLSTD